jgi:biotin carboxylase
MRVKKVSGISRKCAAAFAENEDFARACRDAGLVFIGRIVVEIEASRA